MGAVVPIMVLSYLSDSLGAIPAYMVSALIPVGWVLVDLFFITRRFNFITSFLGLSAIVRGLLAFWFVDGAFYAFKDSVGGLLTALVFAGSLVVGRPLVGAFAAQGLAPRTPEQETSLEHLFGEAPIARTLWASTGMLALLNVATSVANFVFNLWIVTAPFGTGEFNLQVARVNAITRLVLGIPEFVAVGFAIWWVIYSLHSRLYSQLPRDTGKKRDFWDLVELREKRLGSCLPCNRFIYRLGSTYATDGLGHIVLQIVTPAS